MKRALVLLSAFALFFGCAEDEAKQTPSASVPTPTPAPKVFTNGQAASIVIGQSVFTTKTTGTTQSKISVPNQLALLGTKLFVADSNSARIEIFNSIPTTNLPNMDLVLGQSSFTFPGSGSTAAEMSQPRGVAATATQVFVADMFNYRVTIFPMPSAMGESATIAIGQVDVNTATDPTSGGASATTVQYPRAVSVAGTKLAIADEGFNRVSIFNTIPTASNAAASLVLGQSNFGNVTSGAANMTTPRGVWTDGTKVVVADSGNHRVLIWNTWPTSTGQAPDLVLGQSSFAGVSANRGVATAAANSLSNPVGVTSNGTELFIADSGNNRVLMWNSWPTLNGQAATLVLGQPDLVTKTAAVTATGLDTPWGLAMDADNLFVSDANNARVFNLQTPMSGLLRKGQRPNLFAPIALRTILNSKSFLFMMVTAPAVAWLALDGVGVLTDAPERFSLGGDFWVGLFAILTVISLAVLAYRVGLALWVLRGARLALRTSDGEYFAVGRKYHVFTGRTSGALAQKNAAIAGVEFEPSFRWAHLTTRFKRAAQTVIVRAASEDDFKLLRTALTKK